MMSSFSTVSVSSNSVLSYSVWSITGFIFSVWLNSFFHNLVNQILFDQIQELSKSVWSTSAFIKICCFKFSGITISNYIFSRTCSFLTKSALQTQGLHVQLHQFRFFIFSLNHICYLIFCLKILWITPSVLHIRYFRSGLYQIPFDLHMYPIKNTQYTISGKIM